MSTLVSLGNATQPFSRLVAELARIAPELSQPVILQHGTTPVPRTSNLRNVPVLAPAEFLDELRKASLVILHAGAGSVIHAVRCGKKPVVVPRRRCFGEHVDDHQVEFARAMAEEGLVFLAADPEDLLRVARLALEIAGAPIAARPPARVAGLVREALLATSKTWRR